MKFLTTLSISLMFLFWIREKDISEYLDKPKDSKALKEFMFSFGERPENIYKSTDSYYESYYNKGISFCFNYDDRLIAVFIYSKLSNKYKEYKGTLPKQLTFDMTRIDIEKRFGQPDYKGSLRYKGTSWVIYRTEGFGITYNALAEDSLAKIQEFNFQLYR